MFRAQCSRQRRHRFISVTSLLHHLNAGKRLDINIRFKNANEKDSLRTVFFCLRFFTVFRMTIFNHDERGKIVAERTKPTQDRALRGFFNNILRCARKICCRTVKPNPKLYLLYSEWCSLTVVQHTVCTNFTAHLWVCRVCVY